MPTHDKIVVAVRVRPFSNREIKLTAGSKRPGVRIPANHTHFTQYMVEGSGDVGKEIIGVIPFHFVFDAVLKSAQRTKKNTAAAHTATLLYTRFLDGHPCIVVGAEMLQRLSHSKIFS